MANPSPQHNPTDGLNTAVRITLTSNDGNFATLVAGRQYSQPLSVSGATYNGVAYGSSATLTALVKDISTTSFSSGNSNTVTYFSYNTGVATVNASSGVITPVAAGMATIEVRFPSFDEGTSNAALSKDKIYTLVQVQVYP